jgi:hypothetical protein
LRFQLLHFFLKMFVNQSKSGPAKLIFVHLLGGIFQI